MRSPFGLRRRSRPGRGLDLRWELGGISRTLRSHLAPEDVLRTTVAEARRCLELSRAAVWLTTGRAKPRRAQVDPSNGTLQEAPAAVLAAARRRRRVTQSRAGIVSLAVPIVAPRSGLLGVLELVGGRISHDEEEFASNLAAEAAMVLETANLYEQAVSAKEKSEAILARIADAIVVTDTRGRVLERNDAAVAMTNGAPPGRPCAEVLGLRVGERVLDCSKGCELLALGTSVASPLGHEVWRPRDDGRRQPLLANVSAVADTSGAVAEIVHSLRDITKLKEADEAKSLFLATASHELKTPLTVIQGFARLLNEPVLADVEHREEATRAIQRRAEQLNKIVDRLLLSSRIEAGRVEVQLGPVSLTPIIAERVAALHGATGRDVSFMSDVDLPAALADADAVATVLDHLLDNAVKYSPGGEPTSVAVVAGDVSLTMTVADGGIGMDAEQTARCFEKFWQAESSDVRRFGGTGIGLYIVQSFVEAMGGRIAVSSEPGRGSSFAVTLRRADAPEPHAEEEQPRTIVMAPEPSVIREFMRQIGIPSNGRRL